jgi:hypothetical protein
MTNWTQKDLHSLAAALQKLLSASPWDSEKSYLLVEARKRSHAASESLIPCQRTLSEVRLGYAVSAGSSSSTSVKYPTGGLPNARSTEKFLTACHGEASSDL